MSLFVRRRTTPKLFTRWMLAADLPSVTAIELQTFDDPLLQHDIRELIRDRSTVGLVIENTWPSGAVAIDGYTIYSLVNDTTVIGRLAVDVGSRRMGIGTALVKRLQDKIRQHGRRNRIICSVPLSDWDVCTFFSSCGFIAAKSCEGNDGEDWVHMVWRREWE